MKSSKTQLENFKIYKYFRFNDYFKSTLLNRQLWFSHIGQINDPFELIPKFSDNEKQILDYTNIFIEMVSKFEGFRDDSDALQALRSTIIEYREFLHLFLEMNFKLLSKNIGIHCFSLTPNDVLMWSHYSSSHSGVVVEFDFKLLYHSLLELNKESGFEFDFVYYLKSIPRRKIGHIKIKDLRNELRKMFFSKLIKWQYENEFRVISTTFGNIFFDTTSITGIIKGYKMSNDDSHTLDGLIKGSKFAENFILRKIDLDLENENLIIV